MLLGNYGAQERELVQALREAGLKLTPQRLAIVKCLAGEQSHPTAQELYDRLLPRFPSMSLATVYNTLGVLTGIGRLLPLEVGGATRYDAHVAPHHHAICEACGSIRDVDRDEQHDRADTTRRLAGFEVRLVERIYRGVCSDCRREPSR